MGDNKMTLLKGGIIAVVLWIFSGLIPSILLLLVLIFVSVLSRPQPTFRALGEINAGKFSFNWAWTDWLGLALILVVVYAIWNHTDPVKLFQILEGIIKKS